MEKCPGGYFEMNGVPRRNDCIGIGTTVSTSTVVTVSWDIEGRGEERRGEYATLLSLP